MSSAMRFLVLPLACFWAGLPSARAALMAPVTVCADPDPPPWTYWLRDAQGVRGAEFIGFSVDIVRAAFARMGREVKFVGDLPWARCLKSVEAGDVDFAMDAYHDEDRARRFAYSVHYNTLSPQVWWLRSRAVVIRSTEDLSRYRGCGMLGASYAHYGLRSADLDLGVNTYKALIDKLKGGRCDYFVEELEVVSGLRARGVDAIGDSDLAHGPVAGARAPAKHLITARQSPAVAWLPALDAALNEQIASGQAAQYWKRHAPDLAYRP